MLNDIVPNARLLNMFTTWVKGSIHAKACAHSGRSFKGKKMPEKRNMGDTASVKKYEKKSYEGAIAVIIIANDANIIPTRKISGIIKRKKGELIKPIAKTAKRITVPLKSDLEAPQKISPTTTSSIDIGVATTA